ncbi:MAG: hypothetical protein U1E26_03080 [Coriobacteriia bacterium]|nr:hypothetical protein [Coriobacteriia bacterium]
MNHRIVSAVVGLIVAMFVVSAFGFAWAVQVRVPQDAGRAAAGIVPHPADARTEDCVGCHTTLAKALPYTHRYFSNGTCFSCHGWRPLGLVPHSLAMGDARCVLCHGDPGQDLGMPKGHLQHSEKRCSFCHRPDPDKATRQPKPAGESLRLKPTLTHPVTGAFANCLYCHRPVGEPSLPASHVAFKQETCTWCHIVPAEVSGAGP